MFEWMQSLDPKAITVFQLVSQTFFASMSAVVAFVALNIGYRNSNGWRPLVWVARRTWGSRPGAFYVGAEIEFWNRRKYPVVLRAVQIDFGECRISQEAEDVARLKGVGEQDWVFDIDRGTVEGRATVVVEANGHHRIAFYGDHPEVVAVDSWDSPEVGVKLMLFDPKKGRSEVLLGTSDRSVVEGKKLQEVWKKPVR